MSHPPNHLRPHPPARLTAPGELLLTTPGDWQAVFALLDVALDLDPAAQADWLAALATRAPDEARHAPLLAQLLGAHAARETDDFMRTPASALLEREPAPRDAAPPVLVAGALVGPYRLLREIGQGGMASVWRAARADGLLDRQVALKLPHQSWGSDSFAERMARERNILASLTHPNIARLYDAGLGADGRPYIALEYVDGQPIDTYVQAHRLSVRDCVGLVSQVARAVAHAHAHRVVHRDLKPSNILVDAQGQVHLLDFGIARLIDPQAGVGIDVASGLANRVTSGVASDVPSGVARDVPSDVPGDVPGDVPSDVPSDGPGDAPSDAPSLTQAFGAALTPDYASPEQLRGEVLGTASDIYSLGIVAFELFAGARPYRLPRGVGPAALADALHAAPERRASLLADPTRRDALRGDLDAVLAKALARAPAQRYATADALADDLARHLAGEPVLARAPAFGYRASRWLARHKTEAAIAGAVGVALLGGAYAQVLVLLALAGGAVAALWQRNLARREAERARTALARAQQVTAFIASIFAQAVPRAGSGGVVTAADLLRSATQRIDADLAGQPEVAAELSALVGSSFNNLGDLRAGFDWLPKAVERCMRALGPTHPFTLESRWRLAEAANMMGELDVALGLLPSLLHDLRTAVTPEPKKLVEALRSHAFALTKRGRETEAMAALHEAVALATQSFGEASDVTLSTRSSLSNTFIHFGRPVEALRAIEPALLSARAAFGAQRPHPTLVDVERGYADAVALGGQPRDAVAVLRQVLADLRSLDVVETTRVRTAMVMLGRALIAGGHLGEGVDLLTEAEAMHARLTGGRNAEAVPTSNWLALARALQGDGDAALVHFAHAAALVADFGEAPAARLTRLSIGALARANAGATASATENANPSANSNPSSSTSDWHSATTASPELIAPGAPPRATVAVRTLRAQALALRRSGEFQAAHQAALAALQAAGGPLCLALEYGLARVEAAHCTLALGGGEAAARTHLTEALAVWGAGQVDGMEVLAPVRAALAALDAGAAPL